MPSVCRVAGVGFGVGTESIDRIAAGIGCRPFRRLRRFERRTEQAHRSRFAEALESRRRAKVDDDDLRLYI